MVNEEIKPTGDGARSERQEPGFTPGPWEVVGVAHVYSRVARANIASASDPYSGQFIEYTAVERESPHRHEAYANARLIAAAPGLYEALQHMVALFPERPADDESGKVGFNARLTNAYDNARAALALVDSPANEETNV